MRPGTRRGGGQCRPKACPQRKDRPRGELRPLAGRFRVVQMRSTEPPGFWDCGSRLRKGEVLAYLGRNQNLKDLKDSAELNLNVS
jgi:hypothetical protein